MEYIPSFPGVLSVKQYPDNKKQNVKDVGETVSETLV